MTPRERLVDRLLAAAGTGELVDVRRRGHGLGGVRGVVLTVGRKWVLLAETADGGHFDGWTALRIRDVRRVTRDRSFARFFAPTQAWWPPEAPRPVGLDRTRDLLDGLAGDGRLVAVEQEHRRPDVMWVGTIDEVDGGWLWLLEVKSDGSWHADSLGYRLRHLTKITIGSRYLETLASVSPGPARAPASVLHGVQH
jgi:hypothetical protein